MADEPVKAGPEMVGGDAPAQRSAATIVDGCCPDCGYDLNGLVVAGTCPECGRGYTEVDARRARSRPSNDQILGRLGFPLLWIVAIAVVFVIPWFGFFLLFAVPLAGPLLLLAFIQEIREVGDQCLSESSRSRSALVTLARLGGWPRVFGTVSLIVSALVAAAGVVLLVAFGACLLSGKPSL